MKTKTTQTLINVVWKSGYGDWEWFWLLGFEGEFVHLKGANDPDGSTHDGSSFWVHHSSIAEMTDANQVVA